MLAVLSIGSGDGSVQVDVDGYGSFGRAQEGSAYGDAIIDVIGPEGSTGLIWESGVAVGTGAERRFLSDGYIGILSEPLPSVSINVNAENTKATSSFTLTGLTGSLAAVNGLGVYLVQELSPISNEMGQVGALLTQTYVLTNATAVTMPLNLIRYIDVDVVIAGSNDGGGRVVLGNEEWLVTTGSDTLSDLTDTDLFVAISTDGGFEPLTGRFEIDKYDTLVDGTVPYGAELDGTVYNDSADTDEWIDIAPYDTTCALRSDFVLEPSGVATFVTYTVFADGVPADILEETALGASPQVVNVTISNANSTHSFNNPDDDDIDFDGSGIQLQTVPVYNPNTISVQFSGPVQNIGAGSLTLRGLKWGGTRALAASNPFSYDPNTFTATWRFAAALTAEHYLLSLSDEITSIGGNQLDGEWTNPASVTTTHEDVSEFPSGNGSPGGNFNFIFTILPGDGDLWNSIIGLDYLICSWNYGTGDLFTEGDYNGDGQVNTADIIIWYSNYGNLQDLAIADFDVDGDVDVSDFLLWQTGHGDADFDGDTDALDYQIWDLQYGAKFLWVRDEVV